MFEELGFSIRVIGMKDAKSDPEFKHFYEAFKGKGSRIGRAVLTRQQLLSEEWETHKNSQNNNRSKKIGTGERD